MGRVKRESLHLDLDALAAFPMADVERALEETDKQGRRHRKLPAEMTVYLVIALGLMVSVGAREVLRRLLDKIRTRVRIGGAPLSSEAAICKARQRIGYEPLKRLFESIARPVAKRYTRGAFFHGLRLVSLDGSSLQVQDSMANEKAFGRPGTSKGAAAHPVMRFVMLIENGTRVPFAAAMGRWLTSETVLAREVVARLGPRMLCLADRLFYSYAMWNQTVTTGADLLWRVPSYITLPRLKMLPDRSFLSEIRPAQKGTKEQRSKPPVQVRVIEFTTHVGKKVERYRLITTILSRRKATAMELARLYSQRWTIETALNEIKTCLRGRRVLLRSRLPELVQQDFWGLLLAYFGIRSLMHQAADEEQLEPTSLSFLHALNVVIRRLPEAVSFSPSGQAALP
jgi:hypothetical protein